MSLPRRALPQRLRHGDVPADNDAGRQAGPLRAAIGEEAARTAWLYCFLVRDSIYESGDWVENREDGSRIPITQDELADLWTLDLANRLELLRRHPLTPEQQAIDRELYERGARFYSAAGLAAMRRQYGDA